MTLRMSTIQAVVVADTRQFDLGLKEAQKTAEAFSSKSANAFGRLNKDLKSVADAVGMTEKEQKRLSDAMKNTTALTAASRALDKIARSANLTDAEIKKLERSMGATGKGGLSQRFKADTQAAQAYQNTISQLKTAIAGYVGVNMLQDIGRTSINLASIEKTFFALTGTAQGARAEIGWLREESQRLGLDFFALAESFKGFSAAGKTAGMDVAQIREIFTSVTEASTVLGLSSDRTKLALYALEQMLSKGAVSMEELRRQLGDQLPGAFQLGAKAMGLTTQAFAKLVETGKLASAEFLPKFAAELRNAFGPGLQEALKTPRAELQRLMNELTFAKVTIGEGGFLAGISDAAKDLRGALQTDSVQSSLQQLGFVLGQVTGVAAKASSVFIENGAALVSLGAGYASVRFAAATLLPALSAVKVSLATIPPTMAGVTAAARTMWIAIGGPVAALSVLAGGVFYLATRQSEAERISAKYAESLGLIEQGGDTAAAALKKLRGEVEELSATKIRVELRRVKDEKPEIQRELEDILAFMTTNGSAAGKAYADAVKYALEGGTDFEEFKRRVDEAFAAFGEEKTRERILKAGNSMIFLTEKGKFLESQLMRNAIGMDDMGQAADGLTESLKRLKDVDLASALADVEFDTLEAGLSKRNQAIVQGLLKSKLIKKEDIEIDASGFRFKGIENSPAVQALQVALGKLYDVKNKDRLIRADLSENRAVKYAEDAYKKASTAAEQLRLKNVELMESLSGDTLASSLAKIEREYKAQIDAIDKDTRALMAKQEEWRKKGLLNDETRQFVADYQMQNVLLTGQLIIQHEINTELAKRKNLLDEIRAREQRAGITGDSRGAYRAQADALREELKDLTAGTEQYLLVAERLSQAEARAEGNITKLMSMGFAQAGGRAWDDYIDFFEKKLPGAFEKSAEVFAGLVVDVGSGTVSIKDFFSKLGDSLNSIFQDIMKDMISIQLRMAMFGDGSKNALGGLIGIAASAIGSYFAGPSGGMALGSMTPTGTVSPSFHAHGNAFHASTGLSSYRNSVVSSATPFWFAQGGVPNVGVMGEKSGSPGEAIMPLARNSQGDLSVNVTGITGGGVGEVNVYVIDQRTGESRPAQIEKSSNGNGGTDIRVLLAGAVASDISQGGQVAQSIGSYFGISKNQRPFAV